MEKMHYSEDQVLKMSFINICNWLSYFKEVDEYNKDMENSNKNILST